MNTMTVKMLESALYEAELDDRVDVRAGYSGSSMYGATCFGLVVGSTADLARALIALSRAEWMDEERLELLLDAMRLDDFGRGVRIAYFPGFDLELDSSRDEAGGGDFLGWRPSPSIEEPSSGAWVAGGGGTLEWTGGGAAVCASVWPEEDGWGWAVRTGPRSPEDLVACGEEVDEETAKRAAIAAVDPTPDRLILPRRGLTPAAFGDHSVGDLYRAAVASPGIGHILYRITRIDHEGLHGVLVADESREMTPAEAR